MRISRLGWVVLAGALAAPRVNATVVQPPSFESLVADAGEIFLGQVTDRASRWIDRGGKRLIVTDVTFRTSEVLKGSPGGVRTLTFVGGTVGDARVEVPGMPSFMVGDRDVLFVRRGNATLIPLVAMFHGRFRVVGGRNGAGEYVANNAHQPLLSVTTYYAPARLTTSDSPLRLTDFLHTIRTLAGGR